jgi:hypothetical protein
MLATETVRQSDARIPITSVEDLEFLVKEREIYGKHGAVFVGQMTDMTESWHIRSHLHGYEVVPMSASKNSRFLVPADLADHTIGHLIASHRLFGCVD